MCGSVSLLHRLQVCTGKYVLCLEAGGSCNQSQNNPINYKLNWDLHNSVLMHDHYFTRITEATEVENRSAHIV